MAEFLAYRILDEKLKFSQVPKSLKEDVRRILIELQKEMFILEQEANT